MNKNAIKKFAIEARKKLIDSVTDKAGMLGITEKSCSDPITKGSDFEVYQTVAGTEVTLNKRQCEQRRRLVSQIESRGFEAVVEEVAYTWFNRICAIRFMEVNDYLPNRVRVLSSEKEGKMEPDLVTQAPDVDLDLTAQEKEEIINWKMSGISEDTDKMFGKLFLKQCHQLHDILPGLFEADSDYMELLFGISYTNKDDVIYMLVNPETGIPEADFNVSTLDEEGNPTGQVEIIGWLYQYYNTELNNQVYDGNMSKSRIPKELLPAATTIYTPDWAIRYMVENSIGKVWIEHLRAINPDTDEKVIAESLGWKYYLPESKQEDNANIKLAEIRTSYKDLKPTDITCIDPCMGSGHILVAIFDVLMSIYESAGYDKREAAFEIVEHNIHGLDIDQRAYQLSYFAVMMKGRGYNRRFLRGRDDKPEPKVYAITESNEINRNHLRFFGTHLSEMERNLSVMQIKGILDSFIDAKEYGSILNITICDCKLLKKFVEDIEVNGQISFESMGSDETQKQLRRLLKIAEVLADKYWSIITNPPYLGSSRFSQKLNKFIAKEYSDVKVDLSMVMYKKAIKDFAFNNGYIAFITTSSWMFLKSFEKIREYMFDTTTIESIVDFGTELFEGKVGHNPIVAWVNRKSLVDKKMTAIRLVEYCYARRDEKNTQFFNKNNYSYCLQSDFNLIEGKPISYWVGHDVFNTFTSKTTIGNISEVRVGLQTGKNDLFLKYWYEVDFTQIDFDYHNGSKAHWVPHNKGGAYKRWFGNNDYVVYWKNNGADIHNYPDGQCASEEFYFLEELSWSNVSSGKFSLRLYDKCIFDNCAPSILNLGMYKWYILGLLNTKVGQMYMDILSPTLHYTGGAVKKIPVITNSEYKKSIESMVKDCVAISRESYNSDEMSYFFLALPLLGRNKIGEACAAYLKSQKNNIDEMKCLEDKLNETFIKIYGLQNVFANEQCNTEISLPLDDNCSFIKKMISYFVGCIFGRYSLDEEGVIYAGGEWDNNRYKTFIPYKDNCIPITDEEYFSDDIVGRFVEFVKTIYGADTLEENLDFIANALGNKGDTSREVIRNYFLKDFYADHLKVYQKRPIYWLFDSGKQNGFKALIYMHRYDADTVGRVRTDYLHRAQKYVETAMQSAQYTIDNASSASEKSKATKAVTKYTKQLAELKIYDEAIAHIANKRIEIDLDDGVKVNYEKFQGVEVAQEGKKALKVDLLAKLK